MALAFACLFAPLAFAQGPAPAVAPASTLSPAPAAPPAAGAAPHEAHAPAAEPAPAEAKAAAAPAKSSPILPSGDLSPWKMFIDADPVVKAVMLGLAFASVVTWTVWLAKTIELLIARRNARRDLEALADAPDLRAAGAALAGRATPVARFVAAALDEADRSAGMPAEGVKERVAALLSRLEAQDGRRMARGASVIATIGSTAPFVGLFGTVWGIMRSFVGIARTQTTNLAVVAPGIAEALLATAIGLVAAIPAVMIYNLFARWISGYKAKLGDASAEVMRHLSRDLDRKTTTLEREPHVIAMRRPAE